MLYWFIVTLVIMYIVIFALTIEGKHQVQEPGLGTVITKFHGKAFDKQNRAYDEADLRFPEVEPYGVFIMTRSATQKQQEIGTCVDYDFKCTHGHEACEATGGTCVDGFCKTRAWCPSMGLFNFDTSETAERMDIVGLEDTIIEIMTSITFPGIGNNMFVAGKSPGVPNPYRNLTIAQLLDHATPPLKLADLAEKGALVGISFLWNCDVGSPSCVPAIEVKRMDEGKGFSQKRARRFVHGGTDKREATVLVGLRLLVDSSGIGRKVDLVMAIIQLGSCLALLRTASMASDFLMLRCYAERSEMYYKCKVIETKDYSDLQDRLNLIQERAPEVQRLLKRDKFGLGPGGRGGMASVVLRGRR